jgi:hypothetical protein
MVFAGRISKLPPDRRRVDRLEIPPEAVCSLARADFWARARPQTACKKSGKNRVFFNIVIDIPRRRI